MHCAYSLDDISTACHCLKLSFLLYTSYLFDRETVQGGKKAPSRPIKEEKGATVAPLKTAQKIAEQTKVNPSTVQRAEKSFDNEHDVINWIIDNQLSRRNITDDQRAYLLGKRYKEEKKTIGENQYTSKTTEDIKRVDHSEPPKTTAQKIAEQTKVHFNTSEKFFDNEHDVINWIIDNQLSRRNITEDQRAYLFGKRYKEEKKNKLDQKSKLM